jgi:hypothetical protein
MRYVAIEAMPIKGSIVHGFQCMYVLVSYRECLQYSTVSLQVLYWSYLTVGHTPPPHQLAARGSHLDSAGIGSLRLREIEKEG